MCKILDQTAVAYVLAAINNQQFSVTSLNFFFLFLLTMKTKYSSDLNSDECVAFTRRYFMNFCYVTFIQYWPNFENWIIHLIF